MRDGPMVSAEVRDGREFQRPHPEVIYEIPDAPPYHEIHEKIRELNLQYEKWLKYEKYWHNNITYLRLYTR